MKKVLVLLMALVMLASVACAEGGIASMVPAGDKPVLRALLINANADYNTYPAAAYLEEATGYKVEYDMLPASNSADKLNMVIAGNEYYDFIVAGSLDQVMRFAKAGALVNLNDWLQYTPKLDAAINDYERSSFTYEDGLYAIGMQNPAFDGKGSINTCIFLRKDYMEKVGVTEMPDTTEEFTELLRKFATLGDDIIPLTLTPANIVLPGIAGAFGIPNSWNVNADNKLVAAAADENTKAYLQYVKDLYQEGLIDPEFAANQNANVFEKWSTGKAAAAVLNYWDCDSYGDAMIELQPDAEIAYLPPVQGPDGQRAIGYNAGGFDRICFIPAVCENVEHVLNYFEIKLDEEIFRTYIIGEEGTHYTVDENGDRWPINPTFVNERGNSVNLRTGSPNEVYSEYWKLRVKKRAEYWDAWSTMNMTDAFSKHGVGEITNYAPAFDSTVNLSSLNTMFNDECVKIVAGSLEVSDFDAFTEEWMNNGGKELTEDYNNWYLTFEMP
ncbi:MAG: extracellular solute-binding protein [Clostridia bacterium]|nr:extracellular solute-binding protein [Clostridia bacterium]